MIDHPTEAEPVTVVCGDCLDVLRELPDGCVDAVVTDPPYGVGFKYASHDDTRSGYAEWCALWFAELNRVCDGPILISCGTVNVGMWHQIEQPRWLLCWHKPAAMGRSPIGFNNWEPVLHYGRALKNVCDVFQAVIKPDRSLDGHPCPKPLQWGIAQLRLAPAARLVLDPFGGSGTIAVAALHEGRRCIIMEKDAGYCDIIRRRVADALGVGKGSFLAPSAGLFD